MLKKILKIVGIVLVLLVVSAFAIPYFFKDQIKAKIEKAINEKVDAKVAFADADLSLFKNFPNASVNIEKLTIINKAPFAGDTLVAFDELNLKMAIGQLFNSENEPMQIDGIATKNGLINIIFNKDGIGNFDIALKEEKQADDSKSKPLSLKIKEYSVENFRFKYYDERSKIKMVLDSINHEGTGDFAASKLDLVTKTKTKVSLDMDKVNYMKNVAISLDAVLGIDLDQSRYTFKKNEAKINELPLQFDGFIQMAEDGQVYDLTFKTPTSSFKNFLGLIPAQYSSNLKDVKTSGDFTVTGFAKGKLTDTTVPKFNVEIASNNASFQYPNLPKSVQNIVIDTRIINETGVMNDTYVNLDKLSFQIDQDVFNAKANIKNVAENALVNAELKGTINLANVTKAYPVKLDKPLTGVLKADVKTEFDMQSVEKSDYARIKNAGTIDLTGFNYTDENGKTMKISRALVSFDPSRVNLKQFNAVTGKTDLAVNGVLENFYGFVFKNQELKGNFNLNSNQLAVNDFMTTEADAQKETKAKEPMKIPAFLNCSLTAKANTVLYDNLVLKNVSGKIIIKDQKATLENGKTDIFGGSIAFNGDVSTKEKTPKFNMDLGLNGVDIMQTFTQLEMMKKIAPIAGVINGKLNSKIKLSGNLNATEMTPELNSVSGDLLGQLLSTTVNSSNSTLLTALDDKLNFVDLKKLNLNDLKAAVTFTNGKVNVKPFDLKYQDIKVTVGGTHGFDQNMNYNLKLDVPAKYLGTEANNLIAKLSPADAKKVESVPINAILGGTFSNPKVTTDVKQATTNLVNNLVKQQKDKLVSGGKDAVNSIISNATKPKSDTTKTDVKTDVKTKANDLLKGLWNKKKKEEPKPTTNTPQ
ncbi:AsmA-like C-terminal region-containing protein [Flavobacterium sedimenticola]|uniref:AsmA-like C-terminal region-containing protein n=1 Tax=Flavobacterium sedimenticola TaxID=3043286 RepID=A0ABT6XRM4_9FLAO|nr:AsmA-like C-terminal region-containing protein [Flavobacterium sedimenticola]MDI9257743.1 AsmA-like C-terminal region-containing protein [Flavobacterium sedimenticola]